MSQSLKPEGVAEIPENNTPPEQAEQWKMIFEPDPTKQAQEENFFEKATF